MTNSTYQQTVTLKQMTPKTQKQVNEAKRKLKKELGKLGLPTIKNKIENTGTVQIDGQPLRVNLAKVGKIVASRNPAIEKEILENIKNYTDWLQEWAIIEDRSFFYLMLGAQSLNIGFAYSIPYGKLWNKDSYDPEVLDKVNEMIPRFLSEEELLEYKLKNIFSPDNGLDPIQETKAMLHRIDQKSQQEIGKVSELLYKEVKIILDEYKSDIQKIDIQIK